MNDADVDAAIRPFERNIQDKARRLAGGNNALAEDLEQVGRIAIWEAAEVFAPKHGVEYRAWMLTRIHQRMVDELRREIRHQDGRAHPEADDEDIWDVEAVGAGPEQLVCALERAQQADKAAAVQACQLLTVAPELGSVEATQVIELHVYGLHYRQIAKQLGLHPSRVRRIVGRALAKVGRLVEEDERPNKGGEVIELFAKVSVGLRVRCANRQENDDVA